MTGEDATTAPTAPVDSAPPAGIDDVAALFAAAAKLAPEVRINRAATEYLFSRSRCGLSRREWDDEVRLANALYQVMQASRRSLPWEQLVDVKAVDLGFAKLRSADASKGTLLLTFHSASIPPTKAMFVSRCPKGVMLGEAGVIRQGIASLDDTRDALFGALNALRHGEFVLMVPDGKRGRQSAEFKVLGVAASGGSGAAFLAHTSRCNTAWYTLVREGNQFVPIIEPGPAALEGETLASFSARLDDFYAKRLEEIFVGDPRNIGLVGPWAHAFGKSRPVAKVESAGIDSVAALFSAAEKLAPQVKINNAAADYLFSRSRSGLSRREWEHETRLAYAIHQVMHGAWKSLPWEQLVDVKAVDLAFARLRSAANASKGTLLLTFHSASIPPTKAMFVSRCPKGVMLGAGGVVRQGVPNLDDTRDALFGALNVLRDGEFVLIVPDGRRGQQSAEFNVLGATAVGGAGAAFLAHVSRCNTAWYTFIRAGNRFVPVVEPGPAALEGETLTAFSSRLHDFYAKKLEEIFIGDPRNIEVTGRWAQAFAKPRPAAERKRSLPRSRRPRRPGASAAEQFSATERRAPPAGEAKRVRNRLRRGAAGRRQRATARNRIPVSAVPQVHSVVELFSAAEKLAARQVVDRAAVDYLLPRSRLNGLLRRQWERQARLAGALYLIMRRSRRTLPWNQMVDIAAVDAAFARVKSAPNASRGTLLLTFHGAATSVVQEFYKRRCEGGVILGSEVINQQGVQTFGTSRDTLFAALNVLRDGGVVLMAPDGFKGQQSAQFDVLGATVPGGGGAAFLAHTARCNTAWYNFIRDGDRFVPVIEPGPARLDGETLAAFSERLYDFYAKRVEAVFSGDPRNIKLFGRWSHAFALAARSLKSSGQVTGKNRNIVKLRTGVVGLTMSLLARWRKPIDRTDAVGDKAAARKQHQRGRRRKAKAKRGPRQRGGRVSGVESVAALVSVAEKRVPRVDIAQAAVDYLYQRSRSPGLSRQQWEHDARLAGAIYEIMRRSRRDLAGLADMRAVDHAFARLKSATRASKGTLLLTFHGTLTPLALELFKTRSEGGVILSGRRIKRDGIWSLDSSHDVLFAGLDVLRDGGVVLMAPDGRRGQQSAQFKVLGVPAVGGAGAAFLAHTARCNTAWYTCVRQGDRFVPVVEAGPTPAEGETLAAFSERLYAFYATKLEEIFTGDPRNIALAGRWGEFFAKAERSAT